MHILHCLRKGILASFLAAFSTAIVHAVPAKPGFISYPDGAGGTISVALCGDEQSHYYKSADGYMLMRVADGSFRYAVADGSRVVAGSMRATDVSRRPADEQAFVQTIDRERVFRLFEAERSAMPSRRRAPQSRVADESLLNTFPTIGSPRCLVILVEFSDKEFTIDNPRQVFDDMCNKEGFDTGGATGSISDYFRASSNGQFTPQFDVYGPVKLQYPMSFYGGNDTSGNDARPYMMVPEACSMLDDEIDFSVYDTDNDGVIDNVYIFYAGYGEADGGPAASIWPHSWNLNDDLGYEYYFDGKLLNHYATSNELANGQGTTLAGIGVFCHEFSHVMGLPDLYSTTYTSTFTPGEWSLMDHGSYNNNSHTPPTHTAYERYCLKWIEPRELKDPANVVMYPMSQIGNYDDAYIIRTEKQSEYYILENRQQRSWDEYIPGHGLLVWHIDFVPDIWNMNIVNVSKQYVDIVEADNQPTEYTRAGDAFPGTAGVTEFTDDTTPSMRSWSGNALHAPITSIKEQNGIISFMFKGGEDIFDKVVASEATGVKASAFTARWAKVSRATGYLFSVYTKTATGMREYLDGYMMREVGDTDSYEVTGLQPETTYYYVVQATNGRFYSAESDEMQVQTGEPTLDFRQVAAMAATEVGPTSFKANWQSLEGADYYTLTLYAMQLGEPYMSVADFTDKVLPEGWTSNGSYDGRESYAVEAPSVRLTADGSYLQTARYTAGIRTFNFWYRSSSEAEGNALSIMGNVDGSWTELSRVSPLTTQAGGTGVNVADIPSGCTQLRIRFVREAGSVSVDDVAVGYGGDIALLPINGYTDINVGNVTSYVVSGLEPETRYSYNVTAHDAGYSSIPSAMMTVLTADATGVSAPKASGLSVSVQGGRVLISTDVAVPLAVYDAVGRSVLTATAPAGTSAYALAPGLYIVRVAGEAHKVVVR